MSGSTKKRGLVFYSTLSLAKEDHNKEYPLTKFKQFTNCGFGEIFSQCSTTSPIKWS